jgi:glycosyltransferase involved in cell wall biosynthesis
MDLAEARNMLGALPDIPLFVSVGRLNRVKGWRLILDAFSRVLAQIPEAQLLFVGDGEDRSAMERAIAEAGLGAAVAITGAVDAKTVALYLNASNVFICGSWYEGWSYAFVEALSCGIPIVSTDVSGASSMIVNGRNGFIVQRRDPSAFANAMLDALALENAKIVSLQIAEQYSLNHMKKRLSQLWKPLQIDPESSTLSGQI